MIISSEERILIDNNTFNLLKYILVDIFLIRLIMKQIFTRN